MKTRSWEKEGVLRRLLAGEGLPFLAGGLSLIYLAAAGWLRWGDLIIDTGRELYVPYLLLSGKRLYRDVFYLYGPFPPLFNSFLYRLFGVHVLSLAAGGLLSIAACSVAIYRLGRIFLDRLIAAFTLVVFLFVFAFGHYLLEGNYNFVLPYSYSTTYGLTFALWALLFFHGSLDGGGRRNMWLCAATATLALLSRYEMGLALCLSMGTALLLPARGGDGGTRRPGLLSACAVLPLLAAAAVYLLFFLQARGAAGGPLLGIALRNIGQGLDLGGSYTAGMMGSDTPGQNLLAMAQSLLRYLLAAGILAAGGMAAARARRSGARGAGLALLGGLGVLCAALVWAVFKILFTYQMQFRPLPLVAAVVLFLAARKLRTAPAAGRGDWAALFGITLFALLMMGRILLRPWAGYYGFYLLVPGLLIYQFSLFRFLPDLSGRREVRLFLKGGLLLLGALFLAAHFRVTHDAWRQRTLEISSSRGALRFFDNRRNRDFAELIGYLGRSTPPGSTLAVFPEGLTINFLAERDNPFYYYIYLPADLGDPEMTRSLAEGLERKKADYVALVNRSTEEYGYRGFGTDYGRDIMTLILQNYTYEAQFGESTVLLTARR